jgi:glutaconate CoA-transferase subunit A
MGVPFLPTRVMLGSDLAKRVRGLKEMTCPYTGEHLALIPALNPDVAFIHVQRCDPFGNAQYDGLPFMDQDIALAADKVLLTTERVVSNDQIRRTPDQTKIPFFCVEAVVEVPFGSIPHECWGHYEPLYRHMDMYAELTRTKGLEGAKEYLDRFVYEPEDFQDFLNRVGLREILQASSDGKRIYND